jgi:hypothetical protein
MDGNHSANGAVCSTPGNTTIGRCTTPTISNVTLIGVKNGVDAAMNLREGLAGTITSAVAYNFSGVGGNSIISQPAVSTTTTISTTLIETGFNSEISNGAITKTLTELPVTSLGSVPTDCGFGSEKPDYTLKSAYNSFGGGANGVGKFWENWAVFRAR